MQDYNDMLSSSIICIIDNSSNMVYCSSSQPEEVIHLIKSLGIQERIDKKCLGDFTCENWKVSIQKTEICCNEYLIIYLHNLEEIQNVLDLVAFKDEATSLYNRNLWEKMATKEFQTDLFNRYGIIILDIDNLKEINDEKGHLIGDKAIKIVAESIKESIRQKDLAFRYGGDEFLIALPQVEDRENLEEIINRIRANISQKEKEKSFSVEVSIGGAFSKGNCPNEVKSVLMKADQAMYREKNAKRLLQIKKFEKPNPLDTEKILAGLQEDMEALFAETGQSDKINSILKQLEMLKSHYKVN